MSTSNVHIKFFADTPFSENLLSSVAVFTKLFSAETGHTYCVAWEVLRPLPQQTLEFVYPTTTQSIGASYQTDEKNGIGPFSAELGSTWEINQEVEDTPTLKIVSGAASLPKNLIVVKNIAPSAWSGRAYDVSLYRSGKLLGTQEHLQVGSEAVLELRPVLYFGIVLNNQMKVGDVIYPGELQATAEFDLSEYPEGLEVTLKQTSADQFSFHGTAMQDPGPEVEIAVQGQDQPSCCHCRCV